jgi:hypothetical protein
MAFAIRIGTRVMMKKKEGIKGTVLNSTAKYMWNVKWDDGKTREPYKSQQLKEEPKADAPPPASIAISQGKCHIFCRWLLMTSSDLMLFPFSFREPSSHHCHGGSC